MDSLTETIRASRRLLDLADEAQREADWLMVHYRDGHIQDSVFDPVSALMSASTRALRESELLVTYGDDNDLLRADIVSEEIVRLIQRERTWRTALDEIHGVSRESTS